MKVYYKREKGDLIVHVIDTDKSEAYTIVNDLEPFRTNFYGLCKKIDGDDRYRQYYPQKEKHKYYVDKVKL